jgi:ABC-type dipeptide/oligopeptide/nickel transport system permease component
MLVLRYVGRRLIFVLPQLFGILFISFALIKMIPGDPAVLMLGPNASESALTALRSDLGLDKPFLEQFGIYVWKVLHGDLGMSWQTTRPVLDDLLARFPATLELVTLGMALAILVGLPLGVAAAARKRGVMRRVADYYGLLAGSIPDFWLALMLVFVFYSLLQIAPAPMGRIGFDLLPPPQVTDSMIIDSLLARDPAALASSLKHLALPVLTLGMINAGPILKITQSTMDRMLASDFISYADLSGLPRKTIVRQALRASLPSIIPIISVLFSFAIGGVVLVEIVFSWGGAGQYAVQGVLNSDINPVLGFVLFSAILSLIMYLIVDLLYFSLDPRMRH